MTTRGEGGGGAARAGEPRVCRVLVVEDDRSVRESLERALRLEGYQVSTVADGLSGVEAVGRDQPDAVILDINLPKLDGFAVCRALRARGLRMPILMLTALSETANRIAGLEAGVDDYLAKPFDPRDELRDALRERLQSGRQAFRQRWMSRFR